MGNIMPLYFSMSTDGRFSLQSSISADHIKQVDAKIPHPFAPCQRQSTSTMPRHCLATSVILAIFLVTPSHAFIPVNKITRAEVPATKSNPTSSTARGSMQVVTALQMAKKKKAPAASNKIQVKMLKYVEGTGSVSGCFAQIWNVVRIIITGMLCAIFPYAHLAHLFLLSSLTSLKFRSATLSW